MHNNMVTQNSSYIVRVYSNETSEWIKIYNESHTTVLNYNMMSLHPNYYYIINVSAIVEGDEGPTQTLLVKTEEAGQ